MNTAPSNLERSVRYLLGEIAAEDHSAICEQPSIRKKLVTTMINGVKHITGCETIPDYDGKQLQLLEDEVNTQLDQFVVPEIIEGSRRIYQTASQRTANYEKKFETFSRESESMMLTDELSATLRAIASRDYGTEEVVRAVTAHAREHGIDAIDRDIMYDAIKKTFPTKETYAEMGTRMFTDTIDAMNVFLDEIESKTYDGRQVAGSLRTVMMPVAENLRESHTAIFEAYADRIYGK